MPANSPEECDSLFEKMINSGDVEGVVALYEEDAILIQAPGQEASGTNAIRTALTGLVAMKPRISMKVSRVLTAGDTAAVYNDWTGTLTAPDGKDMHVGGKAIEICRRQADGTWKFAIDDPYARG